MQIISWDTERLTKMMALWNKEVGQDFPLRANLFKQNSFDDANVSYEGSYIAVDDENHIIGFVITKMWQDKIDVDMNAQRGWIQAILVDSDHRRHGIGTQLLEHAESYLKQQGIKEIQFGGDLFHYMPGVPSTYKAVKKWVERKHYVKKMETYDLINRSQREYTLPITGSVEYTILDYKEKDKLIEFLYRSFPGRWTYEVIKYFAMGGDGREFIVAKKDNNIIGFCRINDDNSPVITSNIYWGPLFDEGIGGIGPLGIDTSEQKQGYGLAIVQAAMYYLQQRHIKTVIIDWTDLLGFYGKLDFEPWKKYDIYLKSLK